MRVEPNAIFQEKLTPLSLTSPRHIGVGDNYFSYKLTFDGSPIKTCWQLESIRNKSDVGKCVKVNDEIQTCTLGKSYIVILFDRFCQV